MSEVGYSVGNPCDPGLCLAPSLTCPHGHYGLTAASRGITLSTQNCAQAGSCPQRGLGHRVSSKNEAHARTCKRRATVSTAHGPRQPEDASKSHDGKVSHRDWNVVALRCAQVGVNGDPERKSAHCGGGGGGGGEGSALPWEIARDCARSHIENAPARTKSW